MQGAGEGPPPQALKLEDSTIPSMRSRTETATSNSPASQPLVNASHNHHDLMSVSSFLNHANLSPQGSSELLNHHPALPRIPSTTQMQLPSLASIGLPSLASLAARPPTSAVGPTTPQFLNQRPPPPPTQQHSQQIFTGMDLPSSPPSLRRYDTWTKHFEELLHFRSRYGHCRVPLGWKENPTLSHWVSNIRKSYKAHRLPPDKVQRLNDIGFSWICRRDASEYGERQPGLWAKPAAGSATPTTLSTQIASLVPPSRTPAVSAASSASTTASFSLQTFKPSKFAMPTGPTPLPGSVSGAVQTHPLTLPTTALSLPSLYSVSKQQQQPTTAPPTSSVPPLPGRSESSAFSAPSPTATKPLAVVSTEPSNASSITSTSPLPAVSDTATSVAKESLPAAGPAMRERRKGSWEQHIRELIEFKHRYGHCRVPTNSQMLPPEKRALSNWVRNTRCKKRRGALLASRVKQLEELGFEWYIITSKRDEADSTVAPAVPSRPSATSLSYARANASASTPSAPPMGDETSRAFLENYTLLVQRRQELGNLNLVPESDPHLVRFLAELCRDRRLGRLHSDKIRLLEALQYSWDHELYLAGLSSAMQTSTTTSASRASATPSPQSTKRSYDDIVASGLADDDDEYLDGDSGLDSDDSAVEVAAAASAAAPKRRTGVQTRRSRAAEEENALTDDDDDDEAALAAAGPLAALAQASLLIPSSRTQSNTSTNPDDTTSLLLKKHTTCVLAADAHIAADVPIATNDKP